MGHPDHQTAAPSLLPEPGLEGLRLTRAQVARLLGCSKTAVTEWTRKGILTFGGDDRTPAVAAVRQLFERGDVRRLRVRVLREVARDFTALRQTIAELRASLAAEQERSAAAVDAARDAWNLERASRVFELMNLIDDGFDALAAARREGGFVSAFVDLAGSVFNPDFDDDEGAEFDSPVPVASGEPDSPPKEHHDENEPPAHVRQ